MVSQPLVLTVCLVLLCSIGRARSGGGGDAGGAGDRVMNRNSTCCSFHYVFRLIFAVLTELLLTEMDGINPSKQIFLIGKRLNANFSKRDFYVRMLHSPI